MKRNCEYTDDGFVMTVPLCLYARPAVIKALYRFHDDFMISYEVNDENLKIYFQTRKDKGLNLDESVAAVGKELDYQMIRYDTMKQTNDVRQLLVARALYATCIEPEKSECDKEIDKTDSWKEDRQMIFKTWSDDSQ